LVQHDVTAWAQKRAHPTRLRGESMKLIESIGSLPRFYDREKTDLHRGK